MVLTRLILHPWITMLSPLNSNRSSSAILIPLPYKRPYSEEFCIDQHLIVRGKIARIRYAIPNPSHCRSLSPYLPDRESHHRPVDFRRLASSTPHLADHIGQLLAPSP